MNWKNERNTLFWIVTLFIIAWFLPIENKQFNQAINDSLILLKWYAREHVLLCLIPAFFIAGAISVFVSQDTVITYFGAKAKRWLAYLVASVSGTILAVCSCTILPLFTGIYRRGAGLGPAVAFLYSGPAINILAIILTARILGFELGIARFIGAISFSVVIGLLMHLFYQKEEAEKAEAQLVIPNVEAKHSIWQTVYHVFTLVAILIFVNWSKSDSLEGVWYMIWSSKWWITGFLGILFALSLIFILKLHWQTVLIASILVGLAALFVPEQPLVPFSLAVIFTSVLLSRSKGEPSTWMTETWNFAKQILPLLAVGVLIAGFLLGSPEGGNGLIPDRWISQLVGGNSIASNLFASIVGAFMYFATLTEVPILQGLIANGMGKGPALALLLAGPALSLPNMLVIRSVIGTQKTIVYVALVIFMATISGLIFGLIL